MGPVGVVVYRWGLHARHAGDWEGAGWHGPVIMCCQEVNAEVFHSLIRNRLTHGNVAKLKFVHMKLNLNFSGRRRHE